MGALLDLALKAGTKDEEKSEINRTNCTGADLAELDSLLIRLSELEGWNSSELEQRLDERRRMAPAYTLGALYALRAARDAAQAGWPEKPAERALIALCRLVN